MIKISQEDFESKIQDVIDGRTTRAKLIAELKIDRDTLNNKIQELVVHNPKLYQKFIEKFPYRPREYTHIDYEALIIDVLKKGYKRRELSDIYGIDSRTIARKIYLIEESNPDLIALYREVSKYRKAQKKLPPKLQDQIDNLIEKEIFLGDVCDKKREELLDREKRYNEAMLSGMGATEASKVVGQNRVSKAVNTLYRIDLEAAHKNEIKDKKATFKDSLKVSSSDTTTKANTNGEDVLPRTNNSVIGKGIGED